MVLRTTYKWHDVYDIVGTTRVGHGAYNHFVRQMSYNIYQIKDHKNNVKPTLTLIILTLKFEDMA